MVRARSSLRVDYLQQFPKLMHPFIIHTKDVQSDGNCGYRVIANMLGFGEDGWAQVRRDMLIELNAFPHLYEGVYGSSERLEEIRHALNHFDGGAAYDKWMVMPDMGYLISSHYNVVLFLLSRPECLTFLPLRTEPLPVAARRYITVGFINNNHFIEASLFLYKFRISYSIWNISYHFSGLLCLYAVTLKQWTSSAPYPI